MAKKIKGKVIRRAAKARRYARWQQENATALITGGKPPPPFEVYNRMGVSSGMSNWFDSTFDASHRDGVTKRGVTKYRRV